MQDASTQPLLKLSEYKKSRRANVLYLQIRMFRKVGIPGSRRDHYEIQSDAWTGAFRASLAQGQAFQSLLERAAAMANSQLATDRLAEAVAFYRFINEEMIALIAKWEHLSKQRD